MREETGVDGTITDVTYARRKNIVQAPIPDERYTMLTVIFEAMSDGGSISISDEEVLEAQWYSDPPENVLDFVEEHISTWDRH